MSVDDATQDERVDQKLEAVVLTSPSTMGFG
jgi:hypothetical protein